MNRDNLIGGALLGLCAVVAVILIINIAAGTRPTYSGPGWIPAVLGVVFIGALIYGLVQTVRSRGGGGGGGPQWPNPMTGQRPWWRRIWPFNRDDRR